MSAVVGRGRDHLVSYLQPVEVKGYDYLVAPIIRRTSGDLLRIVGQYCFLRETPRRKMFKCRF